MYEVRFLLSHFHLKYLRSMQANDVVQIELCGLWSCQWGIPRSVQSDCDGRLQRQAWCVLPWRRRRGQQ